LALDNGYPWQGGEADACASPAYFSLKQLEHKSGFLKKYLILFEAEGRTIGPLREMEREWPQLISANESESYPTQARN